MITLLGFSEDLIRQGSLFIMQIQYVNGDPDTCRAVDSKRDSSVEIPLKQQSEVLSESVNY